MAAMTDREFDQFVKSCEEVELYFTIEGIGGFVWRMKEPMRAASDEYWLWYRWWDAWQKALSNDQYREVDNAMTSKADLSKYRPAGEWGTVEQPATTAAEQKK